MMRVHWHLVITAVLTGCATTVADPSISRSILDDAKVRSQKYCGAAPGGCEYELSEKADGWTVLAAPIYFSDDGKRVYPFDLDVMYFYDRQGKLTGVLNGN